MITVGDFQSDWRKCNPIKKSSKVNGDGKKHRSVPEVFLAASPLVASPLVASAFGQHGKFPPHARKTSGTQGTLFANKANCSVLGLDTT